MILEFTDDNFKEKLSSTGLTIVDFWSPWCRPCNMLNPVIHKLAEDNSDVIIGKLNTVENPGLTAQFGVSAIPAILFFKDGSLVRKLLGYHSESQLQGYINELKL
jgi:thioredoxin 1